MQRLTAKELQRRYRAGERHFANVDLSGESLRGLNLKGIDLSGADLSRTDIRGTNFSEANLAGTQFVAAIAGTQRRWLLPQLLIAFVFIGLASFLNGASWAGFSKPAINPSGEMTGSVTGDMAFGILGIIFSIIFLALIHTRGIMVALGNSIAFIAATYVFIFIISITFPSASLIASAIAFSGIFVVSVTGVGTVAFALADYGICSFIFSIIVAFFAVIIFSGMNLSVIAASTAAIFINAWIYYVMAIDLLSRNPKDRFIRNFVLLQRTNFGTNFTKSDLSFSCFSKAYLKNSRFINSQLTGARFQIAKSLSLARLDNTILSDAKVQNLLVTLRGGGQSYIGLNLKGAYLVGADLADADFTEADLSQATLEGATLERANLTKTQALGTNFHQTILTGTTLEAWNIDSTTNLEGAICDYVYLLRNQQERRPSSGSFAPGEFAKLFQEVLDTIDLIFQNGIDWKAFIQTFNQVQVQYADAELAVQSIENKGDGVVVVKLHAAPGADKPAIHQSFTEIYQLAFAEAEKTYKAQLHAKDEQITDYRQQNANMQEVIKLLAQRPITVDVKATAESKSMQNDNSRTVTIGGNATNSIIQAGDGNTAELQHITLPPPDRVNIQAELAALQAILASFQRPVVDAVMVEVQEEAAKPAPDKSAIATTLETGLTYARNLQGFAEAIDQLRPHVQNAAGWLGEHGTKLLPLVGLVL